MKIKFLKECGFTVIRTVDQEDDPDQAYDETFSKGEMIDGNIVDEQGEGNHAYVSFQLGDGSMIFGLKRNLFAIMEE